MKKIWLFSLIALIHAYMLPMSYHEKEAKIVIAMHKALAAFEIVKPNNFEISADHATKHHNRLGRWGGTSSSAYINAEFASNPHLLEFASYCAAADIKNATSKWMITTSLASFVTLPFAVGYLSHHITKLVAASHILSPEPQMWFELLALYGGTAAGMFGAAPLITDTIHNYLDKQAFSLACKKLVSEEKIEAMGAYLAYLASKNHIPLSCNQKNEIIRNTLESTTLYSFKIEQFEQERKTTATILDRVRNRKILSSISWQGAGYDESYLLQTNIEKLQS